MSKNRDVNKKGTNKEDSFQVSSASLYSRFKAFTTDSFLITTPIIYIVFYLLLGGGEDFAQHRIFGWSIILGISSIIITLFWYIKAQTPGMKAYELKIVNEQGKRINYIQAFVRYCATLFSIISVFLIFLPYIIKSKKTFQDLVSQTVVIDE